MSERLAAALLAAIFLLLATGCGGKGRADYPLLQEEGGSVRIDIAAMEAGSCRFYSYPSRSGRIVNIIVYVDSAGTPGVTLDACRTCYRWRLGYRVEGDRVACAKCNVTFPLDGLRDGTASCVPIRVPASFEGKTVTIPASALEEGARYF